MQGYVVPELPKKRYFNSSEAVIETRRSELEIWIKTIARKKDLREVPIVQYFLKEKEGVDEFLGDANLYSWAYQSLSKLDRKNMSFEMLKAVALAKTDLSEDPQQFNLKFPGGATKDEFIKDLDDKIVVLTHLRDQFST